MLACAPIFSILIALFLGLILTIFGEKGSINAAFGFLPIVVGMYTFIPGIILLIIGIFLDLFSKNK
jgi:ABC-type methionine transport system permease subunit